MKLLRTMAVLFLVAMATTHALQCSSLLPAKICSKIDAVGDAMTTAITEANKALVEAVKEATKRATELYKAGLTLIKDQLSAKAGQLTGKLKELQQLLDEKLAAISKAQKDVINKASKAIEQAQLKVTEAIQKAVVSAKPSDKQATAVVASAFALRDDASGAMTTVNDELRRIITSAVHEADEVVKQMKSFIETLLKKFGSTSQDVEFFNQQAAVYLRSVEQSVSAQAQQKSKASIALAVAKATDMMDEIQGALYTRKRSISDLWTRVQASLQKLGSTVAAKAKAVIEQRKPEIIKALKTVGKALIDTGKQILLELAKDIVTAVVTSTATAGQDN